MPTGAMPKRQEQGITLAALRVTSKDYITVSGERVIKRGFETVRDLGYERAQSVYCLRCGFADNSGESGELCALCGFDKFGLDKFALACETCQLPFYKPVFTELERAARFVAVCSCFDSERAERALLLSDIRFWTKKLAEQAAAVEYVRLSDLPKVYDNERAALYKRLNFAIIALATTDGRTRAEQRELCADKIQTARRLGISNFTIYERRLLSDLLDITRAALRIDTLLRKRGGCSLTLSERAFYISRYKKLMM